MTLASFALIQYQSVMDGQTDRQRTALAIGL